MPLLARKQFFEFGDQPWMTGTIRAGYMDGLGLIHRFCGPYAGAAAPLAGLCRRLGVSEVLDLASGPGEHATTLIKAATAQNIDFPKIVLSDIFPQLESYQRLENNFGRSRISYRAEPTSVLELGNEPSAMRTMFTSFHHFSDADAARLLHDTLESNRSIFIGEFNQRSLLLMLLILMAFPLFLFIPFLAPVFSWQKLFFCTVCPVIPLFLAFDGVISNLRTYSPEDISQMVRKLGFEDAQIEHGTIKNFWMNAHYVAVFRDRHEVNLP